MTQERTEWSENDMVKEIENIAQLEHLADIAWQDHSHNKEEVIRLTRLVTQAQALLVHSREVFDKAQELARKAQETYTELHTRGPVTR